MRDFLLSLSVVSAIILLSIAALGQVVDVEAVVKSVPKVSYPKEAKETGLEGVVTVSVDVDAAGKVTQIRGAAGPDWVCPDVTRSDVVAMREVAKAAAAKATFTPAMSGGQAVASLAMLPITFENPARIEAQQRRTANGGTGVEINTGAELTAGGGLLNGKATNLVNPTLPTLARSLNAAGRVDLDVLVDERGKVFSAQPISGHFLLKNSAVTAACSSTFPPTLLNAKPVKMSGVITYNFVP